MHRRFAPKPHALNHGIFLLCLDLDEAEEIGRRSRWFSFNRPNLYSFRESDHLQMPGSGSLRESLTRWLAQEGVILPPTARVRLVTLPRVLGYVFNPVSFYFCHDASGNPICAVAEVGNTFGELKPYLVPLAPGHDARGNGDAPSGGTFHTTVPKHFYVSPFSPLDVSFDFRLQTPGESLAISVNDVQGDRTLLVSTLTGRRRPLSDAEWVRLSLRYPLVTVRVITLIHWHALRLWWKRLPWYAKADRPEQQRGVYRPHRTLSTVPHPTNLPEPP